MAGGGQREGRESALDLRCGLLRRRSRREMGWVVWELELEMGMKKREQKRRGLLGAMMRRLWRMG